MSTPQGDEPKPGDEEGKARRNAVAAREVALGAREHSMDARESAATRRELSLLEREEITRLREDAARAREEAREAVVARDELLAQMREANEQLVLATLRAQTLADEADAARLEISASEERFRSLVTASAAVVWQADAEGRVRVDPVGWHAFTGLPVEEVSPGPHGWPEAILQQIHPIDREPLRAAWVRAAATGEPFTHQHRVQLKDGQYVWVASRAVPIRREGAVSEWIGMMTDISARVRVEEAREQFIAILGHDLRNPLLAISMGVSLLRRSELPGRATEVVARIGISAKRIDEMVHDLLDFARGRLGGGIPVVPRPCDVGLICSQQVDEVAQASPGRAIRLHTSGDLAGEWDPRRLEQVLSNLISNAVQHGQDPIEVTAAGEGPQVVIAVHNQGPPIPPTTIARIFEPYQRGARSGARGLGLGLYVASEIVRAHRGTIEVNSAPGDGTTFTVRLPRSAADGGR